MTTPAENIAEAQRLLNTLRQGGIGPSTVMYQNLTQRAIGHGLVAVADVLGEILGMMTAPAVPGLPRGYDVQTERTGNGHQNWRYVLTGPAFAFTSRYKWSAPETALLAGIRHAREQEERRAGMAEHDAEFGGPELRAAQAFEHATANGRMSSDRSEPG